VSINTSREEQRARARRPRLTIADAEDLRARLTVPVRVTVESGAGGSAVGDNGRAVSGVQILGAWPETFEIRDLEITSGRPFTPQESESGTPVIVIGSETAELVFPGLDPVGRSIRVAGLPYRIIGVMAERGSLFGESLDNQVIAPVRSAIQAITAPRGYIDEIIIQAIDPDQLRDAQMEAEGIMRVRRKLRPAEEADFSLETADEAISFWNNISRILFTALPMLVSIALVVGGIVIMNIMLVSVMQRTREVGVRMALGARRRDIVTQFLVEATTLSGVGAVIGVLIGLVLTWIVRTASPLPAAVALHWVVLGVLLGLAVGIGAGVYPALRASRLDPVVALRHE
jgi:putative ABC transport system permease protein